MRSKEISFANSVFTLNFSAVLRMDLVRSSRAFSEIRLRSCSGGFRSMPRKYFS